MALNRLVDNIQAIEAHLEYSAFLFHIIGKPKKTVNTSGRILSTSLGDNFQMTEGVTFKQLQYTQILTL